MIRKTTTGFTLIETVIIIAMTTAMMTVLANLYLNFSRLYVYQQTYIATTKSAGGAINAVGAATMQASHVLASYIFASGIYSSGATTLVLEIPTVNASGSVVPGSYDYMAFYVIDTDLYQLTEAQLSSVRISGTKKIASLVDPITFTYNDADFTKVTNVFTVVTTKLNTQKGLVQTDLQERFYLRNI